MGIIEKSLLHHEHINLIFTIFVLRKQLLPMKYDVFISYSSLDQKLAEGLCNYLESYGICCFVAYRDTPHPGCVDAIVKALVESRMMVLILSDNLTNSTQVNHEIEIASKKHKHILACRLTNTMFCDDKKCNLNWINIFPDSERNFGLVVDGVAKLLDIKLRLIVKVERKSAPNMLFTDNARAYRVGDFFEEGSKQGVVFAVSDYGSHGKIVSLTQSEYGLQWCLDEEGENYVTTGAGAITDGLYNQKKITQIRGWRDMYPAFSWCADQGDGWYLPAIDELKILLLNKKVHDAVNRTLKAKGATELYNRFAWVNYWSSTEIYTDKYDIYQAKYVDMANGDTDDANKEARFYVRAVSAF